MAVLSGTENFLTVENLSVQAGSFRLRNVTFQLARGQVLVVLGPSGSGKSVLLESVAGFNRPSGGRVLLDSVELTHCPPEMRQMGFMFQDYALFPHLSVRENILFSRRFKKVDRLGSFSSWLRGRLTKRPDFSEKGLGPQAEQDKRDLVKKPPKSVMFPYPELNEQGEGAPVAKSRLEKGPNLVSRRVFPAWKMKIPHERGPESQGSGPFSFTGIVETLRIGHLLERYPGQLSGGEKQRVALARVLIQEPKLFLFDEPMSALDARTREELRAELGRILKTLGLTAIYVTHDQAEAWALADQVCILRQGRAVQTGKMEEVFSHPADMATARFIGMDNILKGKVRLGQQGFEKSGICGPATDCGQVDTFPREVEVPGLGYFFTASPLPRAYEPWRETGEEPRRENGEAGERERYTVPQSGKDEEDESKEAYQAEESHKTAEDSKAGEVYLGIRPEDIVVEAVKPERGRFSERSAGGERHSQFGAESGDKGYNEVCHRNTTVTDEANYVEAVIEEITPWGILCKLHFAGPAGLTALVLKQQVQGLGLHRGAAVRLYFPPGRLHVMR